MSDTGDADAYYATLGLAPDATFAQVKARYKELNDAYLKILELSRKGDAHVASHHVPDTGSGLQAEPKPRNESGQASPSSHGTEPIAALKEKLAKGTIDKAEFERLARARYDYLQKKSFSELSDSEFDERLTGFEGLKIRLK